MALQTSGTITMNDIRTELGIPSQAPFGLDQARQGVYVPLNSCSTNKPPTSGAVSLASWYGYNHAATCSCGVTYNMNLPATGAWTNGVATTTIPIPLGSTGNVDITISYTVFVQTGAAEVQFYAQYWNGTSWVFFSLYGPNGLVGAAHNTTGSHSNTLNLKLGTYPGYNTIRIIGEIYGINLGTTPVVYFTTVPSVYVTCPALETCGSASPTLSTYFGSDVTNAAVRWIDLGGNVSGTVDVDWSFVREAGYANNEFRMRVWYNGSFVADTGIIVSSSNTPQTGTVTFTVNGADNKYAVLYYDTQNY